MWLRKESFGGHKVTLGNVNSLIGKVSTVVDMGFSFQFEKDSKIIMDAPVNPPMTIKTQNNLDNFCQMLCDSIRVWLTLLKI